MQRFWHNVFIIFLLFVLLFITGRQSLAEQRVNPSYRASDFARCSRERQIIQALYLMQQEASSAPSLAYIIRKPVRVVFRNMAEFNKALKNYDAVSWLSPTGEQVVFINEKHQNAPSPALAALISHEALHADLHNSIQEEIKGWQTEADVWDAMLERYPSLKQVKKGENALVDRENYILDLYRSNQLKQFVRNNSGYKGLPETSPGFLSP